MSNKDVKKGIAIQANVDAAKVEKLAKGLNAHKSVLATLESGQYEIRDTIGIVLDDLSDCEAQAKYNLKYTKALSELDHTEKRVLCACIYTLINSTERNTPLHINFYTNLEKYLRISERISDFNFENLNNIDSHTDRMIILKVIITFLFLGDESFNFLFEKGAFSWLFTFASVKDIQSICCAISAEYTTLGIEGIISQYEPSLTPLTETEELHSVVESEEAALIEDVDKANSEDYCELIKIINEFVVDEASFGKDVAFSNKDFKKALPPAYSRVAFDSLVAATKIDRGFLVFTTYALYLQGKSILANEYVCLPYAQICIDKITTSKGKQAGTSKLFVPVVSDLGAIKTVEIDAVKVQEERLRDLLIKIVKSGCAVAQTDRSVQIKELPEKALIKLLSAIIYMLRKDDAYLTEVYCLTKQLDKLDYWDQLVSAVYNDKTLGDTVKAFFDDVPYPSKNDISLEAIKLVMGLVSYNNIANGNPRTKLSTTMHDYIRVFDINNIPVKEFNLMLDGAADRIMHLSKSEYYSLKKEIEEKELASKANIITGIDHACQAIDSGLNFKLTEKMKSGTKELLDEADNIQRKVTEKVNKITDKVKKGALEINRKKSKL